MQFILMYLKKIIFLFLCSHHISIFSIHFFLLPFTKLFLFDFHNTSTRSLFDLSSTNGSFVDGEQLTALHSFRISDGSVLSFGGSTRTYTLKWHEGLKHSNILSSERHPQNRPSSPFSTFKSTSNNNSNKRRRGEDDHTNSNNNNSSSSRPSTADSSINTPRGDMSRPSTAGSSNSFMSGGGGGAFHSLEGQSPRVSSRLSSPSPSPRDMGMEKGTSRSGRK